MIVVMMDGNLGDMDSFKTSLELFENELMQTVIPFVEQNFRVKANADNRALAGLSMGGLQTLYTGIRHTDMFSYLGVFSSGWFADNTDLSELEYAFMEANADQINKKLESFCIVMWSKKDIAYNNNMAMIKKYDNFE